MGLIGTGQSALYRNAMNREEFDAAVRQLEKRAARNRAAFRWGTVGWAIFGFSYLILVLLASVGLTLFLVALMFLVPNALTIKLGIIFGIISGGLSWAILRGLFVRMEAPKGLRLQPRHAPKLFKLIEALRKHLRGPRFHEVLLTGEHNAGVVQLPRLGVFGWHRNYLILGLPLLQGISVEEFRAILAHEFAHLSGSHGKFGAWIYRLRRTWEQIFEQMRKHGQGGGGVLASFLQWFWPRFNARAFVLSRVQEYEADALAARVTTPQALATGLIRTQVQGRWLEEKFWPDFYGRVKDQASPPMTAFHELGGQISNLHGVPETARWLTQAYLFETNNADTHPCLKDRLKALRGLPPDLCAVGPPAALPPPTAVDAATVLLGPALEPVARKLAEDWRKLVAPGWKQQHEKSQKLARELAEVEQGGDNESVEVLWKRVDLILQRDGDEPAQPLVVRVLLQDEQHATANFVRGRFLLSQEAAEGVTHLERAMAQDAFLTDAGCQLLYGYYTRNGQREKLKEIERRVDAHQEIMQHAQLERATATTNDSFLPSELTAPERAKIVETLRMYPEIAAVHIVRKRVLHFPKHPLYVVGLTVKVPWWKPRSTVANQKLVNTVVAKLEMPGQFLAFVAEQQLKALGRCLAKVPDSEVYRRPK
jgi:Zn-dependent protease with chaperone function